MHKFPVLPPLLFLLLTWSAPPATAEVATNTPAAFVAPLVETTAAPTTTQPNAPAVPRRCAELDPDQLLTRSRQGHSAIPAQFGSPVLPANGAATLTLNLPASASNNEAWRNWLFCALATNNRAKVADRTGASEDKLIASEDKLILDNKESWAVPVEAVYRPTEIEGQGKLIVQLRLPDLAGWTWTRGSILVVAVNDKGKTAFAYSRNMVFGNRGFAVSGSLFLCIIAYVLLASSVARVRARRAGKTRSEAREFFRCLDPVRLTAGVGGGASLSKLQTLIFSAAVGFLVLYVLLRTGQLTELSSDILLLLGISAGGAVGGKLTATVKNRLSMESFAWIMDKQWIPKESKLPDSGSNPAVDRALGRSEGQRVRWADLVMSGDEFDVYRFQLALFSLVVTIGLLTTSMTGLATFTVPNTLLQVLGLSQVVYIGGKAASPNSYNQLDKKVQELRRLEMAFLKTAAKAWKQTPPAGNDPLAEATMAAPEDYAAYFKAAKEGAAMFESLFDLTVNDSKLKPDIKSLG